MKFPNMAQAKSVGNFRLAKPIVSDYSNRMDRHPVSQIIAQNLERLLRERGIKIEKQWFLSKGRPMSGLFSNLRAEHAVFLLAR